MRQCFIIILKIYMILEKVILEVLLVNLNYDFYENEELNEEVFVRIFKSITDFQKSNLVVVSRI